MVEPLLLLFFFHFYLRVFTTAKIILETIQKIGQKLHFLFFENNVYEKKIPLQRRGSNSSNNGCRRKAANADPDDEEYFCLRWVDFQEILLWHYGLICDIFVQKLFQ